MTELTAYEKCSNCDGLGMIFCFNHKMLLCRACWVHHSDTLPARYYVRKNLVAKERVP